jgi:hypothetical protein
VGSLEVVCVLAILILVTVAALQFGVLLVVEQSIAHAATVSAREAGKGADMDDLVCTVESVLAPHGIVIGPHASVVLEDPEAETPVDRRGTFPCCPPSEPSVDSDEVRVTVCVDLGKKPFFSALCAFGVNLAGKRLAISSLVKKESDG